jgi:hypothetical protein
MISRILTWNGASCTLSISPFISAGPHTTLTPDATVKATYFAFYISTVTAIDGNPYGSIVTLPADFIGATTLDDVLLVAQPAAVTWRKEDREVEAAWRSQLFEAVGTVDVASTVGDLPSSLAGDSGSRSNSTDTAGISGSPSSAAMPSNTSTPASLTTGEIAGIAIGGIAAIALVIIAVMLVLRRNKGRARNAEGVAPAENVQWAKQELDGKGVSPGVQGDPVYEIYTPDARPVELPEQRSDRRDL